MIFNPYLASLSFTWRVFSADWILRNSEAGIKQGSTNGVRTWLLEAYKARRIWMPFHRDDESWASVHLVLVHFQFWGSVSKLTGTKASKQHNYVTKNKQKILFSLKKKIDLSIFS